MTEEKLNDYKNSFSLLCTMTLETQPIQLIIFMFLKRKRGRREEEVRWSRKNTEAFISWENNCILMSFTGPGRHFHSHSRVKFHERISVTFKLEVDSSAWSWQSFVEKGQIRVIDKSIPINVKRMNELLVAFVNKFLNENFEREHDRLFKD